MSSIPQHTISQVGPYHGYTGKAEFDDEAGVFHGEVDGLRDVVTFQANDLATLGTEFAKSVDDYLAYCEKRGESAEKPYSGKLSLRITPEVHKQISTLASSSGVSLNQWISDQLEQVAGGFLTVRHSPTSRKAVDIGMAKIVRKVRDISKKLDKQSSTDRRRRHAKESRRP